MVPSPNEPFEININLIYLNNRRTSFSISGASIYFFFIVLRKRRFRQFFNGGQMP